VSLASWVPKTLPCHYKICWLREGEVQGGISLEKERFSSLRKLSLCRRLATEDVSSVGKVRGEEVFWKETRGVHGPVDGTDETPRARMTP